VGSSWVFPILTNTKKAIWRHLWSIQNEAILLVALRRQRIVIGLGKSRHCQTWLERRFSWNENLQWSKNWTVKSTILKENTGKVKSVFVVRSARWAEKRGCCLEYCRGWKLRSENLRLWSTLRQFDSSFERKGALVMVVICVLCGDSQISLKECRRHLLASIQLAVSCCKLYFVRCCAVKRAGKQGYEFILYIWF